MRAPRDGDPPEGVHAPTVDSLKKKWHELLSKCLAFFRMFFLTTMERDNEHKTDCITMRFLREEQQQ